MSERDRPTRLYLTVSEAAEALRVDPATIYRAIREDAFPVVRVRSRYLIPAQAIENMALAAVKSGGCFDVADFARQQQARKQDRNVAGGAR